MPDNSNPLRGWDYAGDTQPNALLPSSDTVGGLLDSANALALGPLYVRRDPGARIEAGTGSVKSPIEISGGPIKGQSNIVRFGQDAEAIHATLPDVADGYTRLWRGNRPNEVGKAQQFTNDLPGIALPFREAYGGPISYVDVPTAALSQYLQTSNAAAGAEFWLPGHVASQATAVHVRPTQ